MNTQIEALVKNIEKIIVGKREAIIKVISAMLAEGHILIEDVPGVGKTRLVAALANSVDGQFNRIQLTPDIMPSDIVGFSMIDPKTRELEYRMGAAMCNFLLADEINRASPKTQSSLLEVMEEHQISLDGKTMALPSPFMVMATQNPVETYGTYHLPEAQ
ncbi:MAG: AAA family ATPase, partial [Firmicutes bacterium]|nr:AAA family ATPase [Bacillota bacterium]